MIYPNKNIKFKESILYKMVPILLYKRYGSIDVLELFSLVEDEFDSIDQFIISLDVLYALEVISLNELTNEITYAD